MLKIQWRTALSRLVADYGMLGVLLALCAFFSYVTWAQQHPTGADAGDRLAGVILKQCGKGVRVLVVARGNKEDVAFADAARNRLEAGGATVVATVKGEPLDALRAIKKEVQAGGRIDVIAATETTAQWAVFENLGARFPALADAKVLVPPPYWWPNFLKGENLLNIADQIVVIAVLAIGMTMVIVTAGIDLSVGKLIALSAVTAALLIRDAAGGLEASGPGMTLCCLAGVGVCAAMGLFSGVMVTAFRIPPFVVTLGVMWVARGVAYILSKGQSISDSIPQSFKWLGHGRDLLGIPNVVVLMAVLYVAAHVLMTRMKLGRYIYAVGGNAEAARLSGVPVRRVLLLVYTASGALAGLGGIVMASQLKTGSPTYGEMYELYTIAAVVVGGTSLSGGEGKIFGTLIGAFIIAVIQNGMNLMGVQPYTQYVVFGLLILAAVLLDMLKKHGWNLLRGRES